MATITVDTFLDVGAARTAGEIWTNNGARLTVRTDTRWHANAPAGMLGALGSVTVSSTLGGGVTLDGSKVRWMAFTGGSGTVPAIGTTITQGGVSGYLLGVWASITAAPTAVAAAMPATGFIKLRETTGGLYAAGALTGITATAAGPDKLGWIEVVLDQAANVTIPRLGDFTVTGGWFELDPTTGVANQLIPVPTNGSSTTYTPGVYIDDAPITITGATWSGGIATFTAPAHGLTTPNKGSQTRHLFIQGVVPSGYNFPEGVNATVIDADTFTVPIGSTPGTYTSSGTVNGHTLYPAIYAAAFIPANHGTDIRNTFVCMETTGSVRIGHNGTSACGYVPPSGRKVRVPNVFGRQTLAASRNLNTIPSATAVTRPEIITINAGVVSLSYFMNDWYCRMQQAFSVKLWHFITFDYVILAETSSTIDLFNGGCGASQAIAAIVLALTSCISGGSIVDWRCERVNATANSPAAVLTSCVGQVFTRMEFGITTNARLGGGAIQATLCDSLSFFDCKTTNNGFLLTTNTNIVMDGYDHCDRYIGSTTAVTGVYAITVASFCANILMRGVTFGRKGAITLNHPYLGILNVTQSKGIKLRECGIRTAFLNGGATNGMAYIYVSGGSNSDVKIQQVYALPLRTNLISTTNSDVNCVYEHLYGDYTWPLIPVELSSYYKNCGGAVSVVGQASVYGTYFYDAFSADTVGKLMLAFNESTASTAPYFTLVSGTPKFTSAGNLVMITLGDEYVIEQNYFTLGHTALANVAPVVTGTNVTYSANARWGNHDIYYQIDTGNGFGGTWKNLTAALLSAETITPTVGFRLKFRFVCAVASTTNLLTYITITTTSTVAAQANLYPLDTGIVTVTGLVSGTRVKATKISDGTVLFNGAESSGSVSFTTPYIGAISIEARKASGAPYYQPWVTQVTSTANTTVTTTALQQLDQ